jgi:hypothetical protein
LEDVIKYLGSDITSKNKAILRVITKELSIRKGKFGAYAYYKTAAMTKPDFYNIKKFPEGFGTCEANVLIEWLEKTYKIQIE